MQIIYYCLWKDVLQNENGVIPVVDFTVSIKVSIKMWCTCAEQLKCHRCMFFLSNQNAWMECSVTLRPTKPIKSIWFFDKCLNRIHALKNGPTEPTRLKQCARTTRSQIEIAWHFNMSQSTISRLWARFQATKSLADRQATGRQTTSGHSLSGSLFTGPSPPESAFVTLSYSLSTYWI